LTPDCTKPSGRLKAKKASFWKRCRRVTDFVTEFFAPARWWSEMGRGQKEPGRGKNKPGPVIHDFVFSRISKPLT
jgi:hypothetical protein